ncbi:MAG: NAD(P)/FAD-dependent oxidoreductase, partial [Clostridia bacterium]|nr:NAD(P)/FAD-dependent oxidoreductase [Deltaproteobacteria bacterium]
GVAGITCALGARDRDPSAAITVISGETPYFYSRTALMYAFMDKMKRAHLEPYERSVWKDRRIELVQDWAVDLNAAAHTVKLAGGGLVHYDKLVLALGSRANRAEWPGLEGLKGVVNFVSMQDLDACEEVTALKNPHAVVVGGGLIGIELVECLLHHGKAVAFMIRDPYYWPASLSREESDIVVAHMREQGVDVITGDEVASVSGREGRVDGVTTKGGRSLKAEMLGVCIGVRANLDRLASWSNKPETSRGVLVDDRFRTSLPDVFACGDCAEISVADKRMTETIWYSAKRHGGVVASNIFGDDIAYIPPVFFNSSKFMHIEFTTVGDTEFAPVGTPTIFRKHRTKDITQRIVHNDGRVIGFNMLGSRWDNEILARWITERRSPQYALENLREAQMDVEFGRVKLTDFDQRDIPLAKLGH